MIAFNPVAKLTLAIFVFAVSLVASPAQAVPVTVGGTTYDVQFFQGPQSFNDNATVLRNTPWFGNQALAGDVSGCLRYRLVNAISDST